MRQWQGHDSKPGLVGYILCYTNISRRVLDGVDAEDEVADLQARLEGGAVRLEPLHDHTADAAVCRD